MTNDSNTETLEIEQDKRRRHIKRLALISLPLLVISATLVIILLQMSGYAGTMEDTQLGFNADIIRSYFSLMDAESMGLFILGNLADYLFMISYGLGFYCTARLISWDYRGVLPKRVGVGLAWTGVIAAILDGIENVFLLSMTADPAGFAGWLALAHSSFAIAKFLFMYTAMGWLVVGFVLNRTPIAARLKTHEILVQGV